MRVMLELCESEHWPLLFPWIIEQASIEACLHDLSNETR